ncbi:Uncharacterised protein at_DN2015 [Pycnogonum litorale]
MEVDHPFLCHSGHMRSLDDIHVSCKSDSNMNNSNVAYEPVSSPEDSLFAVTSSTRVKSVANSGRRRQEAIGQSVSLPIPKGTNGKHTSCQSPKSIGSGFGGCLYHLASRADC